MKKQETEKREMTETPNSVAAADAEADKFSLLMHRRKKCLDFLESSSTPTAKLTDQDLDRRLEEILEWELFLAEMWTRLEMDARKGDLSFPLRAKRSPVENWVSDHVLPPAVLVEFLDILYPAPEAAESAGPVGQGSEEMKS